MCSIHVRSSDSSGAFGFVTSLSVVRALHAEKTERRCSTTTSGRSATGKYSAPNRGAFAFAQAGSGARRAFCFRSDTPAARAKAETWAKVVRGHVGRYTSELIGRSGASRFQRVPSAGMRPEPQATVGTLAV